MTTQQSALALGVATLGSLFLSLSAPGSLGMRDAFVVVLARPDRDRRARRVPAAGLSRSRPRAVPQPGAPPPRASLEPAFEDAA